MKSVRVRPHQARRRVGEIDGVEVHMPPLDPEIVEDIPTGPPHIYIYPREALSPYGDPDYDWQTFERYGGGFFVSREGGRVSGILQGEYDGHGQIAYIHGVEVYTERRRGTGRRLATAFETWARQRGAKRVRLNSVKDAEEFWSAMGYRPLYLSGGLLEKEL